MVWEKEKIKTIDPQATRYCHQGCQHFSPCCILQEKQPIIGWNQCTENMGVKTSETTPRVIKQLKDSCIEFATMRSHSFPDHL